jgi:hypothetical protein
VNIFSLLKGILFQKTEYPLQLEEQEKEFDLYMINRWCSMLHADNAKIINETTNKFPLDLLSKKQQYDFLKNTLPTYKFQKINYIKRKSVD